MKHDAISPRELPRLIQTIRATGKFSGVRGGLPVTIERDPLPLAPDVPPILLTVATRAAIVTERTATIHAAAESINHIARRAAR